MRTKKEIRESLMKVDFGNHVNVDRLMDLIEGLVNDALKEGTVCGMQKAKERVGIMGLGLDHLINEYEPELRGIIFSVDSDNPPRLH